MVQKASKPFSFHAGLISVHVTSAFYMRRQASLLHPQTIIKKRNCYEKDFFSANCCHHLVCL